MFGFLKRLFSNSDPAPGSSASGGPPPLLSPRGLLESDLWLDQPDAGEKIDAARERGEITAEEAEGLRHFVEQGYMVFSIDVDDAVYADIEEARERLWQERPAEVAFAYHSELKPFSRADAAEHRKPSYRVADLHSYSQGAQTLFLHPKIHRYVELILGQKGVATQSLYFEYGSQQNLHRDPVYVQMQPPAHLVAAWVALEDIDARSGPLVYVPGSQRLPYYALEPGDHRFNHQRHGKEHLDAMAEFDRKHMAEHGMEVVAFTPRRGEVLLWHHSLLHGGSYPQDPALTRKSFVVHFSTREHYHLLRNTYLMEETGPDGKAVEVRRVLETRNLLERDGCQGFDNPLRTAKRGDGAS